MPCRGTPRDRSAACSPDASARTRAPDSPTSGRLVWSWRTRSRARSRTRGPAEPRNKLLLPLRTGASRGGYGSGGAWFVTAGLAALVAFLHFTEAAEPRLAAHFVLDTPDNLSFEDFDVPVVSPDGHHVVFPGVSGDGSRRLWIRSLESPEARPLAGTDDATWPFWSPDGTSVAFSSEGELKTVALTGGVVQRICSLPPGPGSATWNAEVTIVFEAGGASARLFSVAAAGGQATPLTAHDPSRDETGHHEPWFLPDGRHS